MIEKDEIMKSQNEKLVRIIEQLRESKTSLYTLGLLANALDELLRSDLLPNEELKGMLRKHALDAETIYALALDDGADAIPARYERDVAEIAENVTCFLIALRGP